MPDGLPVKGSECILRTKQHLRNGISMNFVDGLKAAVSVSFVFSWIALLIALLPTLLVSFAARRAVGSTLLPGDWGSRGRILRSHLAVSQFLVCMSRSSTRLQHCTRRHGAVSYVSARFVYRLSLALAWTRLTLRIPEKSPWSSVWCNSGPGPFRNWAYAIASQLVFWPAMIVLFARLIA